MEKQLQDRLRDVGYRLEHFPGDVDHLLNLLDEAENLLGKVEQSPLPPIQNAYSKLMKALLAEPIMRHADADVQVAVASCISEITRITAPEAPYEDDQMKEIFQLIVSSFADLSDKSSRSYDKRASILETVAKIRSCVVMLDLECDGLISQMFQHFLRSIRDDHPKNIFESMETIMTVVLEESEDVSVDLLMPILALLKRENEETPSVARKLGESVFEKCAVKLKPFLKQAVKFSGLPLDDYSEIVTKICNGSDGEIAHDDDNAFVEQLAGETNKTTSSDGMTQDAKELVTEQACHEEVPPEFQGPVKSVICNGMTETVDEVVLHVSDFSKKPDKSILSTKPLDATINKADKDDLDTGNLGKVDAKQKRTAKKRGRKPCSTKPSEPSHIDSDKETEIIGQKDSDKEAFPGLDKDACKALDEDPRASPDKEGLPLSLPELLDSEVNVSSLSPSKSLSDESPPEKAGVSKKKDTLAQELTSVDSALKKAIGGTSGSEVKPEKHFEKKKLNLAQEDVLSMDSAPAEAADINSDLEIIPQKLSGKKENFVQEHESSNNLHAVISTDLDGGSDLEIKAQELSRKNKEDSGQEDETPEDLISAKLSDGSSDSEKLSGKEKVNLAQEDAEPVSQEVDDEISDLKDIPERQSRKKAVRTKKETSCMKGNMLKGRGTSKTNTDDSSDEEEELTQSAEGDGSDSETRPLVQSGKDKTSGHRGRPAKKSGKADVLETKLSNKKHEMTNKEKTSRPVGRPPKKSGKGYVSEEKLPGMKEDKTNKDKDSLKKEDSKRPVPVRNKKEKILSESQTKDDKQGMITSPKSTQKPIKDDDPKENSKRKRTPGEDKVSGDTEYGANLVGARVKVWWPDDKQYYEGIIESFDFRKKKHKVSYTDGDEELLVLQKEKWEYVNDGTMQEEVDKDSNPGSSAKLRSSKKAKRNPDPPLKQKQMDVSQSRGGAAAINKLKSTVTKCGGKHDIKSKDKIFETTGRSEEDWESDDKSMDDVLGAASSKSKENEIKAKSKTETPKTVTKRKDKTPRSGNTSRSSQTGKVKSSSSKLMKESSNPKGKLLGSGKTPETAKVKSGGTSKAGKSGGRSGKKRKRGF